MAIPNNAITFRIGTPSQVVAITTLVAVNGAVLLGGCAARKLHFGNVMSFVFRAMLRAKNAGQGGNRALLDGGVTARNLCTLAGYGSGRYKPEVCTPPPKALAYVAGETFVAP